jgi:hypothetical protein
MQSRQFGKVATNSGRWETPVNDLGRHSAVLSPLQPVYERLQVGGSLISEKAKNLNFERSFTANRNGSLGACHRRGHY